MSFLPFIFLLLPVKIVSETQYQKVYLSGDGFAFDSDTNTFPCVLLSPNENHYHFSAWVKSAFKESKNIFSVINTETGVVDFAMSNFGMIQLVYLYGEAVGKVNPSFQTFLTKWTHVVATIKKQPNTNYATVELFQDGQFISGTDGTVISLKFPEQLFHNHMICFGHFFFSNFFIGMMTQLAVSYSPNFNARFFDPTCSSSTCADEPTCPSDDPCLPNDPSNPFYPRCLHCSSFRIIPIELNDLSYIPFTNEVQIKPITIPTQCANCYYQQSSEFKTSVFIPINEETMLELMVGFQGATLTQKKNCETLNSAISIDGLHLTISVGSTFPKKCTIILEKDEGGGEVRTLTIKVVQINAPKAPEYYPVFYNSDEELYLYQFDYAAQKFAIDWSNENESEKIKIIEPPPFGVDLYVNANKVVAGDEFDSITKFKIDINKDDLPSVENSRSWVVYDISTLYHQKRVNLTLDLIHLVEMPKVEPANVKQRVQTEIKFEDLVPISARRLLERTAIESDSNEAIAISSMPKKGVLLNSKTLKPIEMSPWVSRVRQFVSNSQATSSLPGFTPDMAQGSPTNFMNFFGPSEGTWIASYFNQKDVLTIEFDEAVVTTHLEFFSNWMFGNIQEIFGYPVLSNGEESTEKVLLFKGSHRKDYNIRKKQVFTYNILNYIKPSKFKRFEITFQAVSEFISNIDAIMSEGYRDGYLGAVEDMKVVYQTHDTSLGEDSFNYIWNLEYQDENVEIPHIIPQKKKIINIEPVNFVPYPTTRSHTFIQKTVNEPAYFSIGYFDLDNSDSEIGIEFVTFPKGKLMFRTDNSEVSESNTKFAFPFEFAYYPDCGSIEDTFQFKISDLKASSAVSSFKLSYTCTERVNTVFPIMVNVVVPLLSVVGGLALGIAFGTGLL